MEDGSIRQMVAVKRNRLKKGTGQAKPGSKFQYGLQGKHALLLDKLTNFGTTQRKTDLGTLHELNHVPELTPSIVNPHYLKPRTIKIFTLRSFNGEPVISI